MSGSDTQGKFTVNGGKRGEREKTGSRPKPSKLTASKLNETNKNRQSLLEVWKDDLSLYLVPKETYISVKRGLYQAELVGGLEGKVQLDDKRVIDHLFSSSLVWGLAS